MDIYKLYRAFWDWAFENPEKIKPNHVAVYSFAIEHCNRLGWKKKFGFPTTMVMEATGIKSYNTYKNTIEDLVSFGLIDMIERSKNQYSANIIALSNFDKALNKALDKALTKHSTKQDESTVQSTDSIDIQLYNYTNLQENKITIFEKWLSYRKEKKKSINNSKTIESLVNRFNSESLEKCTWVVNNSIENGYQGLFWDNYKEEPKKKGTGTVKVNFN